MTVFDTASLICRSIMGVVLEAKVLAICAETSGRKRTRSISAGMLCERESLSMDVAQQMPSEHITCLMLSVTPLAIWVPKAALTSFLVIVSREGRTEF